MQKNIKISKIGYLFFIVLIIFSSSNFYANDYHLTKQEIWDNMSDDVDHWGDGLGYPVDREIKEIVIALNVMGMKTTASCEEHLDHGCPYPWVDIGIFSTEHENLLQQMFKKYEQIEILETLLETKYLDLSYEDQQETPEAEQLLELYKEHNLLSKALDQARMNYLEPINRLLYQFYENRNISYDKYLIILNDVTQSSRLKNVGTERQAIRSEDQRNFKLIEYREEMKAFAAFLKKKFMNSN